MIGSLSALARPFLSALDPERAHGLAIQALKAGLYPRPDGPDDPRLAVQLFDLEFPNPIGMAAGFDKNGEVPDALLVAGFGFAEIGTVTPRPQAGNQRPRIFRLPADRGVINRLGFNNDGHAAVLGRLRRRGGGIVGINVGANKDSEDRTADYVAGVHAFAANAAYLTVNISSPNTPGLRDLQHASALDDLLARVVAARDGEHDVTDRRVPLLLKIAPDLGESDLDDIAAAVTRRGIDGVIVSNTTLSRAGLLDANARQDGGLSGRPLFRRSTIMLARMRQRLGCDLPLVGVGGIDSGATAYEKLRAGANLVQLYTGLTYGGVELLASIKRELLMRLKRDGLSTVQDAVGTGVPEWAEQEP
jgi:dihydroorotate dehydrogenase